MNRRSFLFSTSIPAATVLMGGIPQGHSKFFRYLQALIAV